jgi:hypothetical protein
MRTTVLSIRIPEKERGRLEEAAIAGGITISDYLRRIIRENKKSADMEEIQEDIKLIKKSIVAVLEILEGEGKTS